MMIKKFLKRINVLYMFVYKCSHFFVDLKRKYGHLIVNGSGNYRIRKYIKGNNNKMFVGGGHLLIML